MSWAGEVLGVMSCPCDAVQRTASMTQLRRACAISIIVVGRCAYVAPTLVIQDQPCNSTTSVNHVTHIQSFNLSLTPTGTPRLPCPTRFTRHPKVRSSKSRSRVCLENVKPPIATSVYRMGATLSPYLHPSNPNTSTGTCR